MTTGKRKKWRRQASSEKTPIIDVDPPLSGAEEPTEVPFGPNPGRYVLEQEVARGGLGRIVSAHDRQLGRRVAVKQLLEPGPRRAGRLLREAFITARLQHPAIVPVHDAGRAPSGEPFYSMKLVEGTPLDQAIAEARSFRERAALVPRLIAVVDAVAYAHGQGVVHRDLKPANVLLGAFGETVVVDWGMAKEYAPGAGVDGPLDEPRPSTGSPTSAALTREGAVVGTPAYMAPEQALGSASDPRADVHALGAMLYHVLAGEPPYQGAASAVLAAVVAGPPTPLREREPAVPEELAAIVAKAMARDPQERYASAAALAQDLRRFETGKLVAAHAYGMWALVRRWARRHRAAVLVATVLTTVMVVTGVVAIARIVSERERARAAWAIAERQRTVAEEQSRRVEERASEQKLLQARALIDGDPTAALAWLKEWRFEPTHAADALAIAAEAHSLGVARHVLLVPGKQVQGLAWSPTGSLLAAAFDDGVRLVRADGALAHVRRDHSARLESVRVSSDGQLGLSLDVSGKLRLWPTTSGAALAVGDEGAPITAFELVGDSLALLRRDGGVEMYARGSSSAVDKAARMRRSGSRADRDARAIAPLAGGWLALARSSASDDPTHEVIAWRPGAKERRLYTTKERVLALGAAPDGSRLWLVTADGKITVISWPRGAARSLGQARTSPVRATFAPKGELLAVSGQDRQVFLHRAGSEQVRTLVGHTDTVYALVFSPDGSLLASGGFDGEIRLWEQSGEPLATLRGHREPVLLLDFSADGKLLASMASDGTVRVWPIPPRKRLRLGDTGALALAYAPDGRQLAASGVDGRVRWWSLTGGGALVGQSDHVGLVGDLAWPRPDTLVGGALDGRAWAWSPAGGTARVIGRHEASVERIAASVAGHSIASVASDGTVGLWALGKDDGRGGRILGEHPDAIAVAMAPDGQLVASVGGDGMVRLWGVGSEPERVLSGDGSPLFEVAFAPDGREVAAVSEKGGVFLWQVASGQGRAVMAHELLAFDVGFSPDGRFLASTGWDGALRVFDRHEGEVRVLGRVRGPLFDLAFAPQGGHIAAGASDQAVRIWQVNSEISRSLRVFEGTPQRIAFAPDGKTVAAAGRDTPPCTWSDPFADLPPRDEAGLAAFLAARTSARIDVTSASTRSSGAGMSWAPLDVP
ncbi:MAG: protein kinase [Deltaproteobacteria bacterium]|nr:protein kinase [Deltaproteobacteria bacterium]